MKYIKTKTEIIEIRNEWEYTSNGGLVIYNENENLYFSDKDIVATANTLEELCDEFMIIDEKGEITK